MMRAVLACLLAAATWAQAQEVTLMHVHGLAYSADGRQLMIPSHHGLAVYSAGTWKKAPGPEHDYMGFSATAKHLYSSGHPDRRTGLANPFGLIRSRDGGKTWDKLGLEGESDFHLLAASWHTNAVYVWNPAPSSRMKARGLHYTLNDGFIWKRAAAAGLGGDVRALAVHPEDAASVAVATSLGLYLSRDSGEQFTRAAPGDGLSVLFDLDGKHLWYGAFEGRARLVRVPLGEGQPVQFALPELAQDAIAYIAQNPVRRREYAIASFARSVFISPDGGQTWTQIANRGAAN
jgi:hypothetical protein